MKTRILAMAAAVAAGPAWAEEAPPPPLLPALSGPLSYNPKPVSFDLPLLGKTYATAIGTGLAGTQSNATPGVVDTFADVSNAMVILQKPEGVFQWLVQAGLYNQETLGAPFAFSGTFTQNTYGPVPQAWVKLAPSANFNVQAGILPTMIGLEAPFTFQNMNIDRGLLWGQEDVMTRGVQANITAGKLALSVALTDGFFSGKYNWLNAAATFTFNSSNILTFVLGAPTSKNYKSTFATPVLQNNSTIFNIIYTYSNGPILLQPYFQYARVPDLPVLGLTSTETWSGALLARYTFNEHWSLPVRFEYANSSGSVRQGSGSVFYGPGSDVFSFTITPTYVWDRFFIRPEFSWVKASNITPGFGFGANGTDTSQVRGRLELGVMF